MLPRRSSTSHILSERLSTDANVWRSENGIDEINKWHNIMSDFHKQIYYDKDENYKIVSDDLYKNGIFDDNDNEIANNIYRKVTMPNENKAEKSKMKNDTRF